MFWSVLGGSRSVNSPHILLGYYTGTSQSYDWPSARALYYYSDLGAVSIRKTVLPGMVIPMLKIRRPNGRLIFNMEITIRR